MPEATDTSRIDKDASFGKTIQIQSNKSSYIFKKLNTKLLNIHSPGKQMLFKNL